VRADMVNGHGLCHGGLVFALGDSAFAFACNSYNDSTVGAAATIDFLTAAREGDELTAEASELWRTRRNGLYEIVVTNQRLGAVGLMLGDGHGGFHRAPGSPFPAGEQAFAFAVADINRDGNPDALVIPYQRDLHDPSQLGVRVLLGDGKDGFTAMPGTPLSLAGCQGPDRVAAGNIFGDGLGAIVVSCAQNNRLFIFRQLKDGTFRTSTLDVQTGWSGIAVAALDSSGKDAIVVSNDVLDNGPAPAVGTITIFFSK